MFAVRSAARLAVRPADRSARLVLARCFAVSAARPAPAAAAATAAAPAVLAPPAFSLAGKLVVLTGAAGGLGLVMGRAIVASGGDLAMVDLNSK